MQLFHLEKDLFNIQGNSLKLFPIPELISQLRKVLRIKKGNHIYVQFSNNTETLRYELEILDRTDQELTGNIISTQNFDKQGKDISMLIAMPNKREKAELIVQKLTEIGVNLIGFWVSEHSIIRQRNDKKADRLKKISREATEQSRGTTLPEIRFYTDTELKNFIKGKNMFLANMGGQPLQKNNGLSNLCGIIGPEGGFSTSDLELFQEAKIIDLGTNVLRMETASIILAWILKNE